MAYFTTPLCTLCFGGGLHAPAPGTSDYVIIVGFDEAGARTMRAGMRQFLRATLGKIEGARASVPLKELQDGRWALHFLSNDVPTLYDRAGCPCITARLCRGSLVRVSGSYTGHPRVDTHYASGPGLPGDPAASSHGTPQQSAGAACRSWSCGRHGGRNSCRSRAPSAGRASGW